MNKIKTPFDWIKHITQYKTDSDKFSEDDWMKFNPFIINRAISMNPNLLELCDFIQSKSIEDPKQIYNIYKDLTPYDKRWYPYIKSKNKKTTNSIKVEALSKYFEVSNRRAEEYIELLGNEAVKIILNSMGVELTNKKPKKKKQ